MSAQLILIIKQIATTTRHLEGKFESIIYPKSNIQNSEIIKKVSAILFKVDPCLINFVENANEYSSEATDIVAKHTDCSSVEDVCILVNATLILWFSENWGEYNNKVKKEVSINFIANEI